MIAQEIPSGAGGTFSGTYWYYGPGATWGITGVGTAADDSVLFAEITLEVCEAINDGLGLTNPPVQTTAGNPVDAYSGEHVACYEGAGAGGIYWYYHILKAY